MADITNFPISTISLSGAAPELWALDSFRTALLAEVAASFSRGAASGITVTYNPTTRAFDLSVAGAGQGAVTALADRVTATETAIADMGDAQQVLEYRVTQLEQAGGAVAPFRFGFYTNDPGSSGSNQTNTFLANTDEFVRVTGVMPRSMNLFHDWTQTADQQKSGGDVYYKFEYLKATGPNYFGLGSDFLPELGIGVACPGFGHDEIFNDILAGNWDAGYYNIAKNALQAGYPLVHIRIMYEWNGGFMPWCPANSGLSNRNDIFVAVYKRIADRCRAALADVVAAGTQVQMRLVWNPTAINYSSGDIIVENLYPGDSYVDVVGLDTYGKAYPRDGSTDLTNEASYKHYLSYPDTTASNPQGDGHGCSPERLAQFALAHNKPFAISECGCGNSDISVGPLDNHWFPEWLKDFLTRYIAQGLVVINVNSWATDQSDGGWGYLFGQRPLAAAAWAANFGKPVVDDGLPKALKFYGNTDGSNYAYLPESPSLRATTQVVRLEHTGKLTSVTNQSLLISKWNETSDPAYADYREYMFARTDQGAFAVLWRSSAGVALAVSSASDGVASGVEVTRICEFNPVTGLTRFYLSNDGGATVTQLGADVTASNAGAILATSNRQDIVIGQNSGGARPMTGTVSKVKIVIGGTTVLNATVSIAGMKDGVSNTFFGRGNGESIVSAATGLPYRPTA
jgi:hypothetical protein